MRLSVLPDDPGYCPQAFGSKVFLDGSEISHVVTADEERRMVVQAKMDERGRVILTPDRESVAYETRYGNVRLELSPAMNRLLTGKND